TKFVYICRNALACSLETTSLAVLNLDVISLDLSTVQSLYPSTEGRIKKMWYMYTMEYYSAEKNSIMRFADKWKELENIILSEVTQTQKDKHELCPTKIVMFLEPMFVIAPGKGDLADTVTGWEDYLELSRFSLFIVPPIPWMPFRFNSVFEILMASTFSSMPEILSSMFYSLLVTFSLIS
ncbi:hypothetical protein STEG23_036433, partial [Scotinomys teguina]